MLDIKDKPDSDLLVALWRWILALDTSIHKALVFLELLHLELHCILPFDNPMFFIKT